jgi:SAM-dependent methyltransferase
MSRETRGPGERWATLLALPEGDRERRELPFWEAVARTERWARVLDAGCGGGFHLRLLARLGVAAFGIDAVLAPLAARHLGNTATADVLATPLRPASCDAVICLGNTMSLLPDRRTQAKTLRELAGVVRAGGLVILQGEDAGALVRPAPLARFRDLHDGRAHMRVFRRHGRLVEMLVGLVPLTGDTELEVARLLPTRAADLERLGRRSGLLPVALPARPPGGPSTWWVALRTPGE